MLPWGKVEYFGQPWHGTMDRNGVFTSGSGKVFQGAKPTLDDGGEHDDWRRNHTLVKFTNLPAVPSLSDEDVEAGYDFRDYAILVGQQNHYSPTSSDIKFGQRSWLFRTGDGTVWVLQCRQITNFRVTVRARRVDIDGDDWLDCLVIDTPADNILGEIGWSHPAGSQFVVEASAPVGVVARYLEFNVEGGSAKNPPTVSHGVLDYQDRNVSDDGTTESRESLLGIRYRPSGDRVEVWQGQLNTKNGPRRGSGSLWVWIGSTRFNVVDIEQVYVDANFGYTVQITDHLGTRSMQGHEINAGASISLSPEAGLYGWTTLYQRSPEGNLISGGDAFWRRGIVSVGWREYPLTYVPLGQPPDNPVEHPLTGEFIDGWWLW